MRQTCSPHTSVHSHMCNAFTRYISSKTTQYDTSVMQMQKTGSSNTSIAWCTFQRVSLVFPFCTTAQSHLSSTGNRKNKWLKTKLIFLFMASRECHAPYVQSWTCCESCTTSLHKPHPKFLSMFHALPFFQNKNTMLTSGLETTKHTEGAWQVQVTRQLRPPASKDCFMTTLHEVCWWAMMTRCL